MHGRLATLALASLLLAGCVATPDEPASPAADEGASPADEHAHGAPPPAPTGPLGLAGSSCLQGGGHSVHPKSLYEQGVVTVVPEPWVPADVMEDVGSPNVFSELPDPMAPIPAEGNTMGNYHATTWCDAWTLDGAPLDDAFVGFVGMRVEPPAFDADGATPTHHYLVTVVATNIDALLERLNAAGVHAMKASAERTALPDGTLRIQMFTEENGDYDSLFKPREDGAMHATHVRLWWQYDLDGHADHGAGEHGAHRPGQFMPVAVDIFATGGKHEVAAGQGYFSHGGTDHHGPIPFAAGKTAATLYRDFDAQFEWGPRPDVMLDLAYEH